MSKKKILVVEDDKDLVKILKYNLEKEEYQVFVSYDGEAGLATFRKERPSLVILDVMMPKMDGYQLCRTIRQESKVPILILSAKKEDIDKILGLELGADDYVTKPFSVREVVARIRAFARRIPDQQKQPSLARAGNLEIHFDKYQVLVQGSPIRLSPKEFEFVKCLAEAQGRPLSREQLIEKIWGNESAMNIDTRTVDQHVARLRIKLGTEGKKIVTVPNVGYRFQND